MTAPAPVPDGTTPPAEAVEAAYRIDAEHRPISASVQRDSITCACGHETTERLGLAAHRAELTAAAVVAALNLPERDRETAAKAWDRGYTAGHSNAMRRMSDELGAPTSRNPYAEHDPAALGRASALRERRES
jgi:hypothetical protein